MNTVKFFLGSCKFRTDIWLANGPIVEVEL